MKKLEFRLKPEDWHLCTVHHTKGRFYFSLLKLRESIEILGKIYLRIDSPPFNLLTLVGLHCLFKNELGCSSHTGKNLYKNGFSFSDSPCLRIC